MQKKKTFIRIKLHLDEQNQILNNNHYVVYYFHGKTKIKTKIKVEKQKSINLKIIHIYIMNVQHQVINHIFTCLLHTLNRTMQVFHRVNRACDLIVSYYVILLIFFLFVLRLRDFSFQQFLDFLVITVRLLADGHWRD